MRNLLLITALLVYFPSPVWPQDTNRFISQDYSQFYNWFQKHSQSSKLYENRSTLYIFGQQVSIHKTPHRHAPVVTNLPAGHPVINIAYPDHRLPKDEIDGYADFWLHVTGTDVSGSSFRGFVWGGDIAKGWRHGDITGDGHTEFVMLGVSSIPRQSPTAIQAEIRILQNGHLLAQHRVPGMCLFEECDTDALLRVLHYPDHGNLTVLETSTLTIGCEVGIDKAFFIWNGKQLECVFQAEYTTQTPTVQKEFSVPGESNAGNTIQTCRFSHEDEAYNPVWECHTIEVKNNPGKKAPPTTIIRAR